MLEVDIGIRSIFRRLVQGVVPAALVRRLQRPIAPNSIRWEYCNIVEPDPQRRLRLNISHQALEKMHPADLADIVEELGPDDREAIIETIDSEVAAEALSEMDPDVQASILESLETEKAAEIIEEMSPDEAADALGGTGRRDLQRNSGGDDRRDRSRGRRAASNIDEHTAGGMMNTEYVALPEDRHRAGRHRRASRATKNCSKSLNTIFLIDARRAADGRGSAGAAVRGCRRRRRCKTWLPTR